MRVFSSSPSVTTSLRRVMPPARTGRFGRIISSVAICLSVLAASGCAPAGDASSLHFEDADTCAECHGGGSTGQAYLPSDSFEGTMMANAVRDPLFKAALAVANQDDPSIGAACIGCHSPISIPRGHNLAVDASALDAIDEQGVGCEACHRMNPQPGGETPYVIGNAAVRYADFAKHGPYADSYSPGHKTAWEPALADASFCGQCHQVSNARRTLRDEDGRELGVPFPLDTTYEEWIHSDYARPESGLEASCIDCHMSRAAEPLSLTSINSPSRPSPRSHALVGGNVWGIQAVMEAAPERVEAFPGAFELALTQTLETLKSAVSVELIEVPTTLEAGGEATVRVRVRNHTGHKFPTGYAESRRAWVAIVLVDEEGVETGVLGRFDPETGGIEGEEDTHVYRSQPGRWNGVAGEPEDHLALHDIVLSDTRIPPEGFEPTSNTRIVGSIDYSDGQGGYRSYDEVALRFRVPAAMGGSGRLVARVYYQSMTQQYLEHLLHANTTTDDGELLAEIFEATGKAMPVEIAAAEAVVEVRREQAGAVEVKRE